MESKSRSKVESAQARSSWKELARSPLVICAALAFVTAAVYVQTGWHDFVNYDDSDYVTANSHVLGGLTLTNLTWAFTSGHASNWHPLTWISHMADCQLFGPKPGPQHLVSVAFHILNTVLLFLVLRALTGAVWRSAVVAGLFALHPLHVESVAWISERKDVLSGCFFMLTLLAYVRAVGRPELETGTRWNASLPDATPGTGTGTRGNPPALKLRRTGGSLPYAVAVVLFALGLMSKPMLVTLPFVLLLIDFWPLQRLGVPGENLNLKALPRLLLEKVPFLALSIASSVVTYIVQQQGGAVSASLTLGQRLANAIVSYVRYLGKTFWPHDLSVLYPHPGSWPWWQVLAAAAVFVALFALIAWQWRRRPYLAVGWLWFIGMLIPVIGLVQVGVQSMADRYTYLPLIGVFIALVWGVAEWAPRWQWESRHLAVVAGLVLGVCALATAHQVRFWRESEALFSHAVKVTTRNYLAYNNLGFHLSKQGKADEAMENYRKSLEINPAYEDALNNMGYALAGKKRHQEAIPYYEAALRIKPDHVEVHNNLGNALSETGRIDEAIKHYRFVLERQPDHADAHNNLGIALAMQGKLDEAIDHFRQALRFKPDYASAHSNLGNAFAVQHKLDEATREYQECLRLNPNDAQAHNNLGNVLAERGKLEEAVEHYQKALSLNANNPEAHFNLGIALGRLGKRDEAAWHYTEALRLKPDYEAARRQLELLGQP